MIPTKGNHIMKKLCLLLAAVTVIVFSPAGCSREEAVTTTAATTTVHEHTPGEWAKKIPSTCTEDGLSVRICTGCGETVEERAIKASGHSFEGGICSGCMLVEIDGTASVNSLGNPYHAVYGPGNPACIAWDLMLKDGILHRAAGDYDKNTGAFDLMAYDTVSGKWITTGHIDDEEISRFCDIDGTVMTPGTDATENWQFGNYYTFDGGSWEKHRTIPGGVHVFDMAKYDGKLFFALGVEPDKYSTPIAYTEDGVNYTFVPLYRDGVINNTFSGASIFRSYELYTFEGKLYAYVQIHGLTPAPMCEIYRFEGDRFEFMAKAGIFKSGCGMSYRHFAGEAEFEGSAYLVQGSLYSSDNGFTFTKYALPDRAMAADIMEENGSLLILAYVNDHDTGGCDTIIYSLRSGELTEVMRFDYGIPPMAFEATDEYFYISMARVLGNDPRNGVILRVDR